METAPPSLTRQARNYGRVLAWDEVQNYRLTRHLLVDRVTNASKRLLRQQGSSFVVLLGSIVSSLYVQ